MKRLVQIFGLLAISVVAVAQMDSSWSSEELEKIKSDPEFVGSCATSLLKATEKGIICDCPTDYIEVRMGVYSCSYTGD